MRVAIAERRRSAALPSLLRSVGRGRLWCMTVRIVFFGSIPVARKCLEVVHAHPGAEVIGVCADPLKGTWRNEQTVWDYAYSAGLPIIDHEDIPEMEPDLGLSVRYHRILKSHTLAQFAEGVVNIHGGLLPEYRGSYCNIHAILNGEKEFGVTMHYMDEGVDTGDIVARFSTPINDKMTGFDLYLESERLCLDAMRQQLDSLLSGTAARVPQDDLIDAGFHAHEYKRHEIDKLRNVSVDEVNTLKAVRTVRAFDSPHHEPAFMEIGDERIYLRSSW